MTAHDLSIVTSWAVTDRPYSPYADFETFFVPSEDE